MIRAMHEKCMKISDNLCYFILTRGGCGVRSPKVRNGGARSPDVKKIADIMLRTTSHRTKCVMDKMSHGQNVTGQNVSRTKCHTHKMAHGQNVTKTKCHPDKMSPYKMSHGQNVTDKMSHGKMSLGEDGPRCHDL